MQLHPALLLLFCAALAGCYDESVAAIERQGPVVSLGPQNDVQAAAQSSPEGTTFKLAPGIYRLQSIEPKNNQKFIGSPGTVFSGARILRGWKPEDGHWVVDGLPAPLHRSGYCEDKGELCTFREDLFVDGVRYKRAAALADLRPGNWYLDNGKALLAGDPRGKTVELGVVPAAFFGSAQGVVLKNITVEKYASEAQNGAIDGTRSQFWDLSDVTAQWNHGGGLRTGNGMTVKGGSFSHNGQIGIVGSGDRVTINSVEINANNFAEYSGGWEAGGTKFVDTNGLVVRNSCVHGNAGPGLWTDINNSDVLYENNIVFANAGDGIKHEISYKATIRGNTVGENGKGFDNWLWGSQILIQNSSNVDVTDNTVEIAADGGNGISMIYQDRGTGAHGPWDTTKNRVYRNKIVFLGAHGAAGMVADFKTDKFVKDGSNRFEHNEYFVKDANFPYWVYKGGRHRWSDLQELGGDADSRLKVGTASPIEFSCNR